MSSRKTQQELEQAADDFRESSVNLSRAFSRQVYDIDQILHYRIRESQNTLDANRPAEQRMSPMQQPAYQQDYQYAAAQNQNEQRMEQIPADRKLPAPSLMMVDKQFWTYPRSPQITDGTNNRLPQMEPADSTIEKVRLTRRRSPSPSTPQQRQADRRRNKLAPIHQAPPTPPPPPPRQDDEIQEYDERRKEGSPEFRIASPSREDYDQVADL